uniref:Uncharacterized protein n=1 Tax=Anguilla anguilla TaxID=7936 RepID=A0A0E9S1L3_ANGAN
MLSLCLSCSVILKEMLKICFIDVIFFSTALLSIL